MQIMISLADATVAQLRDVAELLNREAERRDPEATGKLLREIERVDAPSLEPLTPGGTLREPLPLALGQFDYDPSKLPRLVPEGTRAAVIPPELAAPFGDTRNPAEVFGAAKLRVEGQPVPNLGVTPAVIPPPPTGLSFPVAPPPVAVATGPGTVTQLDRDGLPHDERIHSKTPTMTTDGRWRKRRNLDHATLVAVEAELRSRNQVSLPLAPVIPPPPPVVAAPNAPTNRVMVPPPPPVVTSGVLPAQDANAVDPFRALMRRIEGHTGEGGRLATEIMRPIHAEFGAVGWQDYYVKFRDKIPALLKRIEEMLS